MFCPTKTGWTQNDTPSPTFDFNIPRQRADLALTEFAEQADLTLIVPHELVRDAEANELIGQYSLQSGIEILLAGTGLKPSFSNHVVLSVSAEEPIIDEGEPMEVNKKAGVLAAIASIFTGGVAAQEPDASNTEDDQSPLELEEIIVTGTSIRGARSAAPLVAFDRDEIEAAGVASLAELLLRVPQNFSGGIAEATDGFAPNSTNITGGSGINLRGLGNDSTLVLLNGKRIAPAGFGDFVDVSLIPLSVIDRVEILTDGASAVYGSDAVGGVANFLIREDYEGAETRIRYGSATSGDLDELQFGQTLGAAWENGNGILSYEFNDRDNLDSNDRTFSEDADDPTDLLPAQERHSLFAYVRQDVSSGFELSGTGYYSGRESNELGTSRSSIDGVRITQDTKVFGGSIGATVDIARDWQADTSITYSQNEREGLLRNLETGEEEQIAANTKNKSFVVDAKVDGTLFSLSGGDVKMAIGAQFRTENFESRPVRPRSDLDLDRDVHAFFGEFFVPLVGPENRRPGMERFEISIAGRHEEYSDFGSSTDPKVGVLWSPVAGLNLRGTYGTSFRAPLFRELETTNNAVGFLIALPNPSDPSGSTLSVLSRGNNADLGPETATTWTAGIDFNPVQVPDFTLQATFFNIDFEDRIDNAIALFDAFTDPRFEVLLNRNPTQSELLALGLLPFSQNFAPGFEFTDAEVIVDERLRNLSRVETQGIDLSVVYDIQLDQSELQLGLSGTRLIKQEEQILPGDPKEDTVDTVFNPADLRLWGTVRWSADQFSANLNVNYVDGYKNNRVSPEVSVSSWTTVDLNLTYDTGDTFGGIASNTRVSLIVLNAFDEDPPFVETLLVDGVSFDPANARPDGRTIALQVVKNW